MNNNVQYAVDVFIWRMIWSSSWIGEYEHDFTICLGWDDCRFWHQVNDNRSLGDVTIWWFVCDGEHRHQMNPLIPSSLLSSVLSLGVLSPPPPCYIRQSCNKSSFLWALWCHLLKQASLCALWTESCPAVLGQRIPILMILIHNQQVWILSLSNTFILWYI